MSRTDKHRPYEVQVHDKTLNIPQDHNHSHGECDFYTLDKWKRRFNDRKHRVYGGRALRLNFSCEKSVPKPGFNKMFPRYDQDESDVLMLRTQVKRQDRHTAKRLNHMAARSLRGNWTMEVQDELGDQLTTKRPRKSYHRAARPNFRYKLWVSKRSLQPHLQMRQGPEFNLYETQAYLRYHRANIKSMHGRKSKSL